MTSTGRGLNNTVQLTDICQQDLTITDGAGNAVFQQPPLSSNQPGSCMCAAVPVVLRATTCAFEAPEKSMFSFVYDVLECDSKSPCRLEM